LNKEARNADLSEPCADQTVCRRFQPAVEGNGEEMEGFGDEEGVQDRFQVLQESRGGQPRYPDSGAGGTTYLFVEIALSENELAEAPFDAEHVGENGGRAEADLHAGEVDRAWVRACGRLHKTRCISTPETITRDRTGATARHTFNAADIRGCGNSSRLSQHSR
jgi:hypothetical protein